MNEAASDVDLASIRPWGGASDLAGSWDFRPRALTTDEGVKRFDEEHWRQLDRTPNVGEVAWFAPEGV